MSKTAASAVFTRSTEGGATPSFVVSHDLPLDEAPDAYEKFDQRIDGYTKVILKPDAA